ncbi:hypothetical protein TNCV_4273061 [Trichonephila clavipes]|nr:hypothetical protein TNCV_4273061 [Trichonephila clavipes]
MARFLRRCSARRYADPRPLSAPAGLVVDEDRHRAGLPPHHRDAPGAQVATDGLHRRPAAQEEAQTSTADPLWTALTRPQQQPVMVTECHDSPSDPFSHVEWLKQLKSVGAQSSSGWLGVPVRRRDSQFRCHSCHLIEFQNGEVLRQ